MRPGTAPPPFESAEQTILDDPGGRNIKSLFRPGHLESACRALAAAKRIGIVTGFYVPSAAACETDGPLGAAHLATTLRAHVRGVAPSSANVARIDDVDHNDCPKQTR